MPPHFRISPAHLRPDRHLGSENVRFGARGCLAVGGSRVQDAILGTVQRLIVKRVSAAAAAECFIDLTPPPPPRETLALAPLRDRGAGRPTKRDRRELERLRGRDAASRELTFDLDAEDD